MSFLTRRLSGEESIWAETAASPTTRKIRTLPSTEYALFNNYPNPINPATQIKYQLPVAAQVNISIYNMLGR